MTTFRDAMGQVLSSHGAAKVAFTIRGFKIIPGMFVRLKKILPDRKRIFVKFDDAMLSAYSVDAMYIPSWNTFYFPEYWEEKTHFTESNQTTVMHECFHAICDMNRLNGINIGEEETCAYITQSILATNQFGGKAFSGPFVAFDNLIKKIKSDPTYDIVEDSDFLEVKKYCQEKILKKTEKEAAVRNFFDGI